MARFGATVLDADGHRLSADERAFFKDANPFGFILFARNIDTPDQVRALCDDMRNSVGRNAVITVDQEGGRVQRLRAPQWRDWHPPLDIVARTGPQAARAMYLMYRIIADELRAVGIDSNCAPTVDVIGPDTHPFLRNRCYGQDVSRVVEVGRAVADGLMAGGVLPVIKHMPGHGRATKDSHHQLPHVNAPSGLLQDVDFAAFRALNDVPMGMTAHLVYEAFDEHPATLSANMMHVIRQDIGFDNLIMTDDISMKALDGTPAYNARRALDAGCDVALYCNAPLHDRAKVAEAAGEMSETAQARALRVIAARSAPDDVDISALNAEFDALLGEAGHG